jgi:hypothetical protein
MTSCKFVLSLLPPPVQRLVLRRIRFGPGPAAAVKEYKVRGGRGEDATSKLVERRIDPPIPDRPDSGFVGWTAPASLAVDHRRRAGSPMSLLVWLLPDVAHIRSSMTSFLRLRAAD